MNDTLLGIYDRLFVVLLLKKNTPTEPGDIVLVFNSRTYVDVLNTGMCYGLNSTPFEFNQPHHSSLFVV